MKKFLLIFIIIITAFYVQAIGKDSSPETISKTQEIISSIEKKDISLLKTLIDDPAAINTVVKGSFDTYTPLIYVIKTYGFDNNLRFDVANILIEAGAKANIVNDNKMTALMYAAQEGNIEIVNLLIKSGANVNLADDRKMTALMLAVRNGHDSIVDVLIKNKADLNKKSITGEKVIFFCIEALYYDRTLNTAPLDLLLANGADPIAEQDSLGFPFIGKILFELRQQKDDDKRKFLEKILKASASNILEKKPNYIVKQKGLMKNRSMLMMLAEYSRYVSSETLDVILSEAAQSKADFSLKSVDKKTAFEYLPAIVSVNGAIEKINQVQAYQLFFKYNADSGRPYKNAKIVIEEKQKH